MNTLQDLEAHYTTLAAEVVALRAILDEARSRRDPWLALIHAARKSFRSALDRDNKSGKKSELDLRLSYQKAVTEFGYRGGIRDWEDLITTKL